VIRFLFRWLFRLMILAIVGGTALLLTKDLLLREWVVYRLRGITGLETRLGQLQTGLLNGTVTLTDLRIYNSAEFGGGPFLSVPDLHLELDGNALRHGQVRLKLGRLHLSEFNLVRNFHGETNIFALARRVQENASDLENAAVSLPGLEFAGIDVLNLTLGTVRLTDMARPGASREFRIDVTNETLREVASMEDLTPLLFKVIFRELGAGLRSDKAGETRR
jgi:hypothetical protein